MEVGKSGLAFRMRAGAITSRMRWVMDSLHKKKSLIWSLDIIRHVSVHTGEDVVDLFK